MLLIPTFILPIWGKCYGVVTRNSVCLAEHDQSLGAAAIHRKLRDGLENGLVGSHGFHVHQYIALCLDMVSPAQEDQTFALVGVPALFGAYGC